MGCWVQVYEYNFFDLGIVNLNSPVIDRTMQLYLPLSTLQVLDMVRHQVLSAIRRMKSGSRYLLVCLGALVLSTKVGQFSVLSIGW